MTETIQQCIMRTWEADEWRHAGHKESSGACLYTLHKNGRQIGKGTLLELHSQGLDKQKRARAEDDGVDYGTGN